MKSYFRILKKIIRKIIPFEGLINYCWHLPIETVCAARYGFPGKKIKVIGVAGTKGKTTTAYFVAQLLEGLGKKVALYSTAAVKIAGVEELNTQKMTTPGRGFMHALLRRAIAAGCEYAVLEISSHGLKQFRLVGIPFSVVVLTNMMPDHLDYHKTAKDYTRSHQRMIGSSTKVVVYNAEDPHLKTLNLPSTYCVSYGKHEDCDMRINNIQAKDNGTSFTVSYLSKTLSFWIPTLGRFNIYNTVAALGALRGIGVDISQLNREIASLIPAPGRMEKISNNFGCTIIVDYAHSPDSFEQVFKTLTPIERGSLITVTGACGDRDARVRPAMGKLAGTYSSYVILTNDDPYTEDPDKIVGELRQGLETIPNMKQDLSYWIIMDRREAIKKGISLAKPNDIVLILGKGAEQWQVFKDEKIPWDDRQIVREILEEEAAR